MKYQICLMTATILLIAGCDIPTTGTTATNSGFIKDVPESLVALAGPNQDLTAIRVDPIDGCYVYRHIGPVETTMLPLRTAEGRPICTRKPDETPTT